MILTISIGKREGSNLKFLFFHCQEVYPEIQWNEGSVFCMNQLVAISEHEIKLCSKQFQ